MSKTEGIFLNLQCNCHRVASMFIKLINLYTNFSTLLPNVTALCSVLPRIEKGHFCSRNYILRALSRVKLHFEGTFVREIIL